MDLSITDGKTAEVREISGNEDVQEVKRRKVGADKEMMHEFLLSLEGIPLPPRRRLRKEMSAFLLPPTSRNHVTKVHYWKNTAAKVSPFKTVELSDEDGPSIIGRKVDIYGPGSRRWFRGRVKAFDHQRMIHKIYYDDGDKDSLDLKNEIFRMEVFPGENFILKPKSKVKQILNEIKMSCEAGKVFNAEHSVGLTEKDSEKAVRCGQALSARKMAGAEVGDFSAVMTGSHVTTSPEMEENMVEVNVAYPTTLCPSKMDSISKILNGQISHLPARSFEDKYLDILQRKLEAEDTGLRRKYFEHLAKRQADPCSKNWENLHRSQKECRIPLVQLTCTRYFVRKKTTVESSQTLEGMQDIRCAIDLQKKNLKGRRQQ